MSPRNVVLPLNYLCIKLVSAQLIQALSDDEGLHYKVVSEYFLDTTYEVLQELLKNILNSINLDAATRFSCLEVLLREDVNKLDTGIFPHSYYEKILSVIELKGTGLQQLNLKGVWVRDHPKLLSQLIINLKKLRVLIIPHMADDTVLNSILSLNKLVCLDISGEACFSVNGLNNFRSDFLKVLEIGYFGKKNVCEIEESGPFLIADLIEKLPNLLSLKTYSFTGSAILILHLKNPTFKTKLTYLHDTGTTLDIIKAIVKLCPDLESVHLDSAEAGVIQNLTKLKKLNCLKLTKPNNDDLLQFLRESGTKLEVLKLNHNKNSTLDLCDICLNAPNVHTLECYQMKLTFSQLDTYFMTLQNVELLYCEITDTVLKLVLTNSPFLKRIVVGCVIRMTDGDIFRLCADCEFACLEELWISCARGLTSTSVELLMGHCPNLKVLGQLSGWDVHEEELDYLRSVIISTNTDLTLLPVESLS